MARSGSNATTSIPLTAYNPKPGTNSQSPHPGRRRSLKPIFGFAQSSPASEISAVSQDIQEAHPPLFIPRFAGLRQICLDQTQSELRMIESELQTMGPGSPDRSAKVVDAVRLLQQLDRATESEVLQLQMEDPEYAKSRGLTIVHFIADEHSNHDGQWMMLSRAWGKQSKNTIETNSELLSPYHQQYIRDFVSSLTSCKLWFQRPKTAAEKQRGSLIYHLDGSLTRRAGRIVAWKIIIIVAMVALVCFYGVGIISTNTTFSPIFVKYFYWVAIFWSLISSYLLSWIVTVFGATTRDSFGSFLSAIAIWLVVVQIGQTHLNGQIAQAAVQNSTSPLAS